MKYIYIAALILAGLDFSVFYGAIMAEVSQEFEEHLRAIWSRFRQ